MSPAPQNKVKTTIGETVIEAEVYTYYPESQTYYAKIYLPQLGLYINSFTIKPSPKYPDKGMWVQGPTRPTGKSWIHILESANDNPCWLEIQQLLREAVEVYTSNKNLEISEDLTNEDIANLFKKDT